MKPLSKIIKGELFKNNCMRICQKCGCEVKENEEKCPRCGSDDIKEEKFCRILGTKL